MRTSVIVLALLLSSGCFSKKSSSPASAGAQINTPIVSTGFVEISWDDEDEDDLDDLMGSDLMKEKTECNNLVRLEPAAMMGKLTELEINCLEDALRDAVRQTHKRKLSLLLMADGWTKGDKARWDAIVSRHLEEIDRSDPDLCYKYALYLAKKGPTHAPQSIRWADTALENRSRWSGDTHIARVYALYRLKAKVSQKQWLYLEDEFVSNPSDEIEAAKETARNQTKVFSREWLDYARSAGKDATRAQQMCEAAAGTISYCES